MHITSAGMSVAIVALREQHDRRTSYMSVNAFRFRDGIVGGLIGGMVMAMVAMGYGLVAEGDLLAPLKQMGGLFFPSDSGSIASLVAGLMLHMMTAAVFGVVFVALARAAGIGDFPVPALGRWPVAAVGMMYILVEWVVASFLVLPVVDRPLLPTFASLGGIVAHAMYGVVLGWWVASRAEPVRVHVHQRAA
jgi:hypothetical protein